MPVPSLLRPAPWSEEHRTTTLVDVDLFRTIASDSAGLGLGPSGHCVEHLQGMLLTPEGQEALYAAALRIGADEVRQGQISSLVRAFRVGSLTGLQESQKKTRGIVVGDVLRKSVSKTLVKCH